MSPKSSSAKRTQKLNASVHRVARKEGLFAPPTLEARVRCVEDYLRMQNDRPATSLERVQNLDTLHADVRSAQVGALSGNSKKPTIKPRLESLIDRLSLLCVHLDQLDHAIAGNGGGGEIAGNSPSPFTIPDQLEALEHLIDRALAREAAITDRF